MTEGRRITKADLLTDIHRAWEALNTILDRLTEAQLTELRDKQGWAVKDHLIHITSWERSVAFFLQGKPRHEGLGIDEALYLSGSDDAINAVIYQQRKGMPLTEAMAQLRDVHRNMLELLQPMTDMDLTKPYRTYLPDEPGEGEGPPAYDVINGNTAVHFSEHLGWIVTLVAVGGQPGK
jgi:hypothetical protein